MWTRLYNVSRDVIDSWDTINAQVILKPTNSDFYARLWVQNLG